MPRIQVYLTESQDEGLRRLARSTGRSQSDLIRAAVDRLIAEEPAEDWKASLLSAAGIWADRPEVEDEIRETRAQLQRRHERMERSWRKSRSPRPIANPVMAGLDPVIHFSMRDQMDGRFEAGHNNRTKGYGPRSGTLRPPP